MVRMLSSIVGFALLFTPAIAQVCEPGEIPVELVPPKPRGNDCPANIDECGGVILRERRKHISTVTSVRYRVHETITTIPVTETNIVAVVEPFVTKRVGRCLKDVGIEVPDITTEIVYVDTTTVKPEYIPITTNSTTTVRVPITTTMPCIKVVPELGGPTGSPNAGSLNLGSPDLDETPLDQGNGGFDD